MRLVSLLSSGTVFNKTSVLSLALASSLLLAGCETTGSQMAGTAADSRLTKSDSATFFSKSGYQACAVGAGVGVLACLASNSGNKAACAVAAGIASCGVAMGANYYLDNRRGQYANSTQRLQAMTQDVRQDTQRVVQRTEVAKRVINDDKLTLAQINRDIANKKLNHNQARNELASIDSNIAVLRKDLANMKNKAQEYSKVAQQERNDGAGNNVVAMEREIAQMNQKVAALQNEVDGLYRQRSAIKIG